MNARRTDDLWQSLYVPPAPGDAPCAGKGGLFEIDALQAAAISRANSLGKPPSPGILYRLDAALRYCARCPLAVREWCDEATKPTASGVAIIAGGRVYSRGVVVWDVERQAAVERAA